MDGNANYFPEKMHQIAGFCIYLNFPGVIPRTSAAPPPLPSRSLDPDTNFRSTCQRSQCSCFTKRPLTSVTDSQCIVDWDLAAADGVVQLRVWMSWSYSEAVNACAMRWLQRRRCVECWWSMMWWRPACRLNIPHHSRLGLLRQCTRDKQRVNAAAAAAIVCTA